MEMAVISKRSDHSRHCSPFSKLICHLVMLSNQLRVCHRGFLNLQLSLLFLPLLHNWATLILNVIGLSSIRIFLKQKLIITSYIFLTLFFLFFLVIIVYGEIPLSITIPSLQNICNDKADNSDNIDED